MNRHDTHESIVVIKKDAIDAGIDGAVIDLLDSQHDIDVTGSHDVQLDPMDVLKIYEPELEQDPTERRQILMAMAALYMTGTNRFVSVRVHGQESQQMAFNRLNQIKGSIKDTPEAGTVRGMFPHPRPEGYENLDFWFQSPFFVQNRIHVPDSQPALAIVEEVAACRGIARARLYGAIREAA